jgi:hypothetical protein
MQRVSVDSNSIASIGYAPERQVLELEFRQSGEVYQYFERHLSQPPLQAATVSLSSGLAPREIAPAVSTTTLFGVSIST